VTGIVRRARLRGRIDEGAAAEIVLREPFAQRVRDGDQPLPAHEPGLDGGHEPRRPVRVAPVEEGGDQVVFRWEMAVQRHLGDAGLGDDPVDAGGTKAVAVEQALGCVEDAVAGGRLGHGRSGRSTGLQYNDTDLSTPPIGMDGPSSGPNAYDTDLSTSL